MKARTRKFSVDVIRFARSLPREPELEGIRGQLVNAASSAADNYRSATRSRSHAEFTARIGTALDEADESASWLTTLREAGVCRSKELDRLLAEAAELRDILARSTLTVRENERKRQNRRD